VVTVTTTDRTEPRGLVLILGATALAGISGYAIQLLAAALIPSATGYVQFSAFWSAMYLLGSAVGGIQQEVARASHPYAGGDETRRSLRPFLLCAVLVVAAVGSVVAVLAGQFAFTTDQWTLEIALVVGLIGYVLTSIATGLFYGVHRLAAVAALVAIDAVARGIAVVTGLAMGAPLWVLAYAIAVPFGLAVGAVWLAIRSRVRGRYTVDVSTGRLGRNALHTVVAAAAIGLLVTGMPLVFKVALADTLAVTVASLTLLVTLTRAPFIIPVMALQSYLIVSFRSSDRLSRALVRRWGILIAGGAIGAVAIAWFVGPWAVDLVSSGEYDVGGLTSSLVVLSALLVGLMCVTGPMILARSDHFAYAAGWLVAAATTLACFLLPLEAVPLVVVALLAGPVAGLAVHGVAIARRARSRTDADPIP
jgi:hypothetical protein